MLPSPLCRQTNLHHNISYFTRTYACVLGICSYSPQQKLGLQGLKNPQRDCIDTDASKRVENKECRRCAVPVHAAKRMAYPKNMERTAETHDKSRTTPPDGVPIDVAPLFFFFNKNYFQEKQGLWTRGCTLHACGTTLVRRGS